MLDAFIGFRDGKPKLRKNNDTITRYYGDKVSQEVGNDMELKIFIKKRSKLRWIIEICLLIALFIPNEIIRLTSIYSSFTPEVIWYKYHDFYFSLLFIPIIIMAIIWRKKSKVIRFDILIFIILLKDFVLLFTGNNLKEIEYNFSMFLILLLGWSIACLAFKCDSFDSTTQAENFFDLYLVLAIASQLLRLALRMSTDGRYSAMGLSVGGTGYFTAIYILYTIYYKEYNSKTKILLMIAFLGLILSGQRTNLLMCILFLLPFFGRSFINARKSRDKKEQKKAVFLWFAVLLGITMILTFLFLIGMGMEISGFSFITRTFDAITGFLTEGSKGVSSIEGRLLSLQAGFEILRENPIGFTNNFYDLQYKTNQLGFPTFPHNTFLDCMLLWSPPITISYVIWLISLCFKSYKYYKPIFWPLMYVVVLFIVSGSPYLVYPYLFIELYIISLANIKIKQNKRRRLKEL